MASRFGSTSIGWQTLVSWKRVLLCQDAHSPFVEILRLQQIGRLQHGLQPEYSRVRAKKKKFHGMLHPQAGWREECHGFV
jgi:hypothetical protein